MTRDRLRIVVGGYLVRAPLGGQSWHYLQYVAGLARLGHEILYLEDSCFFEDDEYEWYYDPAAGKCCTDPAFGLKFVHEALKMFGREGAWAFYEAHADRWHGPAAATALEFCKHADLFLNVSGVNPVRPWLASIPRRVFVDTDPAFTQIRVLTNPINRRHALQHNVFATFGENIPAGRTDLPKDVIEWIPTRQPMTLDAWPVTPGRPAGPITAVLAWQTYPALEHDGRRYGVKADSFQPLLNLPVRSSECFELALSGDQAPREMLRGNGWVLLEGGPPDPAAYQTYLQASKAEFGIAKAGYVTSRSGWFSERSAAYLSSGRPVVVQNTGFTDWLPAGDGVLAFDTADGALSALENMQAGYARHCRAARELVTEYFGYHDVLSRLIDDAFDFRSSQIAAAV